MLSLSHTHTHTMESEQLDVLLRSGHDVQRVKEILDSNPSIDINEPVGENVRRPLTQRILTNTRHTRSLTSPTDSFREKRGFKPLAAAATLSLSPSYFSERQIPRSSMPGQVTPCSYPPFMPETLCCQRFLFADLKWNFDCSLIKQGSSSLHYACAAEDSDDGVVQKLLELGCDPNLRNSLVLVTMLMTAP